MRKRKQGEVKGKESAKKEAATGKNKNNKKMPTWVGGRTSRRVDKKMSNAEPVHKMDVNGCAHDDREQWRS